ncbi:MAG TPA: PASTA domain-containing protein [Streptosporangiaceae bacterium]|nr:PASTA domain-containing protein [Streptosporangiaceae bacterium]
MSLDKGEWQGGREAWERLTGWHQKSPSATPGRTGDEDGALTALADIGLVRRLLDQAELVGVRTARAHRKSWAEIATMLGVTRQSAWERWRDLDEPENVPLVPGPSPEVRLEVEAAEAAERSAEMPPEPGPPPRGLRPPDAEGWRRRSSIMVPDVIGMPLDDAQQVLHSKTLVAVGMGPDPDGPPLTSLDWPGAVVTDQSPESGAMVPAGTSVTLWVRRGGGSAGVREPRRPDPDPKGARETRDEAAG